MKLFDITADYRKYNENKPHYYVVAENKKSARAKFSHRISWLDIYGCEEITDEARKTEITSHPYNYIVF